MRKYIICFLICLLCLFSFVGCSSATFDSTTGFVELDNKDLPDEYKDTGFYCYNEQTGVVYVGFNKCIVRLESADYEFYIYDKQKKEFIGYNR